MQLQEHRARDKPVPAIHPNAIPPSPRSLKKTVNGGSGNRDKWLQTFRAVVDVICINNNNNNKGCDNYGGSPKRVKTILRPPTTYRYIIGMSGFPSKVAIYPVRRM